MVSWIRGSTEAIVLPPTFKDSIINSELPSRTASLMLISFPNSRARAAAIASISTGWSAWDISWASDAMMDLVWSRVTTPMPLLFSFLKIASSKFILKQLASGGFHFTLGLGIVGGLGGSIARNSANFSFTCDVSWSKVQQGLWVQTWFPWCHIPYVIIANRSELPWFFSIHDRSSLKFVMLVFWWKFHSDDDHTELSSLHDHNACNGLSSSLKLRSHSELSVMCCLLRFAFVGIESRQARHNKFLILFGTCKSQMLR